MDPRIYDYYVEDGKSTGRPKEISVATEEQLLQSVRADQAGREKSSEVLAYECGISCASALRALNELALSSCQSFRQLEYGFLPSRGIRCKYSSRRVLQMKSALVAQTKRVRFTRVATAHHQSEDTGF